MIYPNPWAVALVGLALSLGALPQRADSTPAPITGTWTGQFKGDDEIQLNLDLRMNGQSNQMGQTVPLTALHGLPRRQALAAPVQFELARDAGTVAFEGTFQDGKGGGSFTFTPRSGFVEEMAALGFRDLSSSQILTMAMLDVSREYARELKALGYDRLSTQQLISMRIFQVTRDYVTAMRSQGYTRLQPEQLVQLRIFGGSLPGSARKQ